MLYNELCTRALRKPKVVRPGAEAINTLTGGKPLRVK